MREFFKGWRRKVGMMLIILPLTFSWRLIYICIEDEPMIEQWRFRPNWSITIPLTLLSAYLILWQPRTKPKEQSNA